MTLHQAAAGLSVGAIAAALEMLLAILITLRSILKEMRK